MLSTHDFGYIINRQPYRENSFLIDAFTEHHGKIRCIARVAKHKGKITKGSLEPFLCSHLQWSGKTDLLTLQQIDERIRHKLDPVSLLKGFYMNELLLRLLLPNQNDAILFHQYQTQLALLASDRTALVQFELQLLESLGYSLIYPGSIAAEQLYYYTPDVGFIDASSIDANTPSIIINGQLLLSLQHQHYPVEQSAALRFVLDQLFRYCLAGKPLNSRKMLSLTH